MAAADLTPTAFYTYMHVQADTGRIFYVGKGKGRRAYRTGDRNKHWHHVTKKHGYSVVIAATWPTEGEAFEHERFLISTLRALGHPLINLTDGGEGVSGRVISDADRARRAELSRRLWADPKMREKIIAGMMDPEARQLHRQNLMAVYDARPEKRALASEKVKARMATPEGRRQLRRAIEARNTEDFRQRVADQMRSHAATPEGRAQVIRASLAASAPESIAKARAGRAKNMQAPGFRDKLAKAHGRGPFVCIQTGQVFHNQRVACETLGLSPPKLCRVLAGHRRTTGGYGFVFVGPLPDLTL